MTTAQTEATAMADLATIFGDKAEPLTREQAIWRGELIEIDMGLSESRSVSLHIAVTKAAWDATVGAFDFDGCDDENPWLLALIDAVRFTLIKHPQLKPGDDAIGFFDRMLAPAYRHVHLNLYVGWGDHGQSEDPVITISLAEED